MTTPQTPALAAAAASSSSSSIPIPKVFLSFGDDTSKSFSDHLYKSMVRKGIDTFWGYEKIEKGETIDTKRLKAIDESRFAIVVFSREYPSSAERLDELVKIAEMKLERVYPVFYDVEPSEVRKQKGTFGDAFALLLARQGFDVDKVNKWRNVLTEMANLAGWDVKSKYETDVIEKITKEISDKLNNITSSSEDDLVGIDYRISGLLPLLGLGESDDVRVIGIWGMPGVGKTTLADVVFQSFRGQFDASCFIMNVRERDKKDNSLVPLQESVYKELINDEPKIQTPRDGTKKLAAKLRSKKVLIILDDVDHQDQIKDLTGDRKLKPGSRIIVTTRNKHLLEKFGANNVFEVVNLTQDEALKLLCMKAFNKDHPPKEYEEVCKLVVRYARGLPLALEVLGCFLDGRSVEEWYSTLERLKKYHDEDGILRVLKISFDGLRQSEKELFLDIACFFQGEPQYRVEKILESRDYGLSISIKVLVEKALIRIGGKDRCMWMHDLLQELGKEIVRRKSFQESDSPLKEPQERSRLWDPKDISDVLKENTGTNAIEGIFLTFPERKMIELNDDPFLKMKKLKLLKIHNAYFSKNPGYLCKELRLLEWDGYPSTSLPSSFQPENLVELNMPNSLIEQIWEESDMELQMLLWINLRNCKCLTRTPSFSMTPNLEKLTLEGCESLSEIHTSLEVLKKLVFLNLKGCKNLLSLPSGICGLTSLKVLNLSGCSHLDHLPEKLGGLVQLEVLNASGTGFRKVPSSIVHLKNLEVLSFSGCKGVALDTEECSEPIGLQLPDSFAGLVSLRSLDLSGCNLSEGAIPHDIGCLSSLQSLDLSENNFISIPDSICLLFELRTLRLNGCKKLRWLPKPPCIKLIEARDCPELKNNPNIRTTWLSNSGLCEIDCSNSMEEKNDVKCYLTPVAGEHYRPQFRKHLEDAIYQSIAQIQVTTGDGIPDWCSHSSNGPSVTVLMSHSDVDSDSMWMGFAVCVICTTPKKKEELVFEKKQIESTGPPDVGSTQFTWHFETGETRLQKSLVHDIPLIGESLQLFVYIPREWFSGDLSFANSITASVSFSDPKVEVKECGALLITKQNVEEFTGSLFKQDRNGEDVSEHLKEITDHARKYEVRKEMESAIEECVMICEKIKLIKWRPRSTSKGIPPETSGQECTPPTPHLIPLEEANTSSTNTNQLRSELQELLSSLFEGHRARNHIFSSIFPVKAILPQFTNQCVGNDVFCCLPPGLYDDNSWVGFALYVVLTRHPSASLKNLDSKVQHPLLTVEMEIAGYKIFQAKTDFEEDHLFGLPRLVLLYIPRVAFSEILKISCSISSLFSTTLLDEVDIELCGIRLVYEQDLKEIIQTVIECTLQSPEVYHQRYCQNFADIQNGETSTDLCSSHCLQSSCNFSNEQVPEQSSNSHRHTLEDHLLQEYYQSFHRRSTYNSCFPQTEIPEWFKCHSNDGPSMRIQLPSNLHDDSSWIGLALWASFSTNELPASIFDNRDSSSPHYLLCNLETNGSRLEPLNVYQITKEELKWLYFGGFIWLCYLPRESCFDLLNQCEFLEASFGSDLPDLQAHKCALRLVYEKDEIEFGNTVLHCLDIFTGNWDLIPDSITKGTSQHLTPFLMLSIMAEAPVHRIDKATQWQRNLKNLLQHFFRFNLLAILTIEGHFISTFRGFDPDFWYDFGFPHKAILEWFQHQSCSSHLQMQLPKKDLSNDRNWAGFVMCASFKVHEHPTVTLENFGSNIFVSLLCHFRIKDQCLVSPPFELSKEKFKWFYKRGFIWMRYMPGHYFPDMLNEVTSVEVSFHSPDCPSLTVEKCGIRLLYQHEVEEFKQTIIEYTTSFFDDLTPILEYIEDENEKKYGGTSGISENPFLGTHQGRTFGTDNCFDNSHNSESRVLLDFHRDFRYNSCYPHLDIDWFSHSNSGPSVTNQHLSPCLERDDNWIGLALFACFSNLDDLQPTTFVDHHLICQL